MHYFHFIIFKMGTEKPDDLLAIAQEDTSILPHESLMQ